MATNLSPRTEVFTELNMKPRSDEEINADYLGKLAANTAACLMHRAILVANDTLRPGETHYFDREFDYENCWVLLLAVVTEYQNLTNMLRLTTYYSEAKILWENSNVNASKDIICQLLPMTGEETLVSDGGSYHEQVILSYQSGGGFSVRKPTTHTKTSYYSLIMLVVG